MSDIISISTGAGYVPLPTPSEYTAIPEELNSDKGTGRNVAGDLHMDRITTKRTISLAWSVLTPAQKDLVLQSTSAEEFNVLYFDLQTGEFRSGKFYRGNRPVITPLVRWEDSEFRAYRVSFELVEYRWPTTRRKPTPTP